MSRKVSELQVGIITILAVIVFIVGMMWFKSVSLSRGVVTYYVDFERVEGLQERNRVQVRGIRLGQVSEVNIQDDHVRVALELDDEVVLGDDATVTLGTKGIVGEVVIEIDPGDGARVGEGHVFTGHTAATIADMTDAAGTALEELQTLAVKVTDLVDEIQQSGRLTDTLQKANSTLGRLDSVIDESSDGLVATLDNMEHASAGLRELMESGTVDRTVQDARRTFARADSMLATLETATVHLESILDKLDTGEGSAARLLNDPLLYDRADSTLASLKRLIDDLRRNPKKYLKLNVVDF